MYLNKRVVRRLFLLAHLRRTRASHKPWSRSNHYRALQRANDTVQDEICSSWRNKCVPLHDHENKFHILYIEKSLAMRRYRKGDVSREAHSGEHRSRDYGLR